MEAVVSGEISNRSLVRKGRSSSRRPKIQSPLNWPDQPRRCSSVSEACRAVVENLEKRQLLSTGWMVSYWANNQLAGTDAKQPTYVVQDNGSGSAGTVTDLSGNTVPDAINYAGNSTTLPPQLAAIGVSSTWTNGSAGNNFSTRFDGILTAPETATYTFYPGSDDGDQLIVDGQLLDNHLGAARGVTYDPSPVNVVWQAGSTHQVSFLYQNGGGGWGQDLRWSDSVSIDPGESVGANAPYVPISAISMPSGPVNASVAIGSGSNTIKWGGYNPTAGGTPTTDSGTNLSYDVYRAPASIGGSLPPVSAFTKIASAVAGNSYTDTTATANTVYDYRVTTAGVALTPSGDLLNDAKDTGLASALDGTSANSTGTNDVLTGSGDGLTAQYFNSTDDSTNAGLPAGRGNDITAGSNADNLTQDHAAVYSRIDTKINTDSGSATQPPGVPANFGTTNVSIRWDGYVLAPTTGNYTFLPASDDNERFSVGTPSSTPLSNGGTDYGTNTVSVPGSDSNETIIAEGTGSGSGPGPTGTNGTSLDFLFNGGRGTTTDTSQSVYALAGQLIPIQMDYNQGGGGWHYSLNWSGPTFPSTLLTAPDLYAAQAEAPTVTGVGGYQAVNLTLSLPLSAYATGGTAADSYDVYRSTTQGVQGPLIGTITIPNANANSASTTYTFNDTGLNTPATYYYTVTAVAGGVQSAPTTIAVSTSQTAPAAPNTAVARNANGTTTISWPAVAFTSSYTVLRSSDGTNFSPLAAGTNLPSTTTSFVDATASGSNFYYYEATATNPVGSTTSGSVYVANGDGFAVTYFTNDTAGAPAATATNSTSGFVLSATPGSPSSYWQDGNPNLLTPVPSAAASGFSATNGYQTIDQTINFTGNSSVRAPSTPTGFNSAATGGAGNATSGEWDFTIIPQYAGQYTFYPSTDDGTQFYVDGVLLDDQSLPGSRGNTPDATPVTDGTIAPGVPANLPGQTINSDNEPVGVYSGNPVTWTAGSVHTIRMIWANAGGGWDAHLYWSSGGNTAAAPSANFGQPYALVPVYEAYATISPANVTADLTGAVYDTAPAAAASTNNNAVQLTWDSSQADSYQIYRSTTQPTVGTSSTYGTLVGTVAATPGTSPGVPTYTFTDSSTNDTNPPQNGTQYYFTIVPLTANQIAGTGGIVGAPVAGTPTVISATPQLAPPAAPTITTSIGNLVSPETLGEASIPASNVTVSWGTVPFASSYSVQRAVVTNGTAGAYTTLTPTPITTTSYTDPTAAVGTIYSYEVTALNAASNSGNTAGSTSTGATADLVHGVIQNYWANTQIWGSTIDTDANTTGGPGSYVSPATTPGMYTVGNPTISSFQPDINFVGDGGGAIAPPGGSQGGNYSVELTGKLTITTGGTYTFTTATDDFGALFIDGSLVAAGGFANNFADVINQPVNLNPGTYTLQFYQNQGGGGHQFVLNYNGPDTNGNTVVVPASALNDQIGAPSAVTLGTPTLSSTSPSTASLTFLDINTNEQYYYLQRSLSPTFASGITTVQTQGLQDNQDGGTPGNQPTVTISDPGPLLANTTYYYRVLAVNFSGSTPSTNIVSVTTGAPVNTAGALEAWFYANEWWDSTPQNTSGFMNAKGANTGVGGTLDSLNLRATDSALLTNYATAAAGNDTGSGTLESGAGNPAFPDPNSAVGPDNFSDVFTGQITITNPGTYTFAANTDDDGYMYVDDKLVSAYPGGHGPNGAYTNYPVTLTAGQHDVEFFQSNGGGGWAWNWLYTGPDTGNAALAAISTSVINSVGNAVVAPTTFTVATAANPSQATITWSNNNTSAIRYVIERSTSSDFSTGVTNIDVGLPSTPANAANFPATTSITDSGLTLGTQYYYRLIVENYDGSATTPTTTITTANQYPQVSSLVADQDVNGNIQVSFPTESFPGITGYQVLRSVNGGSFTAVAGSPFAQGAGPITFTDPAAGLSAGTTYQYEVITTGTGSPANSPAALSNPLYYVGNTVVNHASGFVAADTTTDLTVGGNGVYTPIVTSNGQLQISTTVGGEATNTFTTTPIAIDSDFSTSFDFQFTNPNADGFAFVIQNQGNNVVGGSGGVFGYGGDGSSLAVVFNMYNGVTQTQLGINGNMIGSPADMSGTLGNAFHNLNSSNATDVFQVSLNYNASTQTLYEAVRDTTTGLGYSTSYNLASSGLAAEYVLGPGSNDYVGFTAGTGGATSQQNILDWVVNDAVATLEAGQPSSIAATEDINGNIQISFPGNAPVNGVTSTTYQILKSVNGGAYTAFGSPIPYSSTAVDYTMQDSGPFIGGATYQYEVEISGTTPASPATSAGVFYVFNPVISHSSFSSTDLGTDLTANSVGDPAIVNAANQLQLTDGSGGDATSVFTTSTVQINSSWQTSFDFEITNPGADGMTFTIQSVGNTALGGGGGSLGYAGGSFATTASALNSIAFAFNQYNGVTQTAVGANGVLAPYVDMSATLGNAFHSTPSNSTTDTFQVNLAYNAITGNFYETVRDERTGQAFSQTITPTIVAGYLSQLSGTTVTPAQATASVNALFASPVYVGFTGATGGVTSTQKVNDWTFNTDAAAPVVTSLSPSSGSAGATITINGSGFTGASFVTFGGVPSTNFSVVAGSGGDQITAVVPAGTGVVDVQVSTAGGGTSAISRPADQFTYVASGVSITSVVVNGNNSALAGVQRSMVDSIVYTFNQAVNLGSNAFSIALNSTFASGTLPTLTWTAINPNADGSSTQWAVTFSGAGVLNGSIGDGVYNITINGSAVTADSNPAVTGTSRTDTFYRLFGDATGVGSVTGTDYNALLSTFNLKSTAAGYLAYFNEDGAGKIDAPDYNGFLNNFGKRFKNVTTITTI
jgi:hypothetical protein